MKTGAPSFASHVQRELTPYRLGVSVAVSVLIAGVFAVFSLGSRASSDQQVLAALSPYLATLVETGDRPEILRVLHGVKESRNMDLVLVQRDQTFASTRSVSEMDQSFLKPAPGLRIWGSGFNRSNIVSSLPVLHQGGPSQGALLYSFTPLGPTLVSALGVSLVTLIGSLFISFFSARQMRAAIKGALRPLEQLHREIQGLSTTEAQGSDPIQVRELEEIRQTISKTKLDLTNARERLAEEKAKKLSANAYRDLIHNLHNPLAALRRMVGISVDPSVDEATQAEAQQDVARIADQILFQISSAKKNLENQPLSLRETDLRDCVRESARIIETLRPSDAQKQISVVLPDQSVVVAHDPTLLQSAVVNLLENGLEASRERVELSLEMLNGNALIRVSDDGPGMDESQLSIYLQGRGQSKKAKRQAHGLSSASHIVRTHGGKIVYKRSELGGASFEIRLEVAP
ncbi:MAG: HAMP domain-containing histidine kinase [Oligoflexia bacterium]|nr:HAMP domain-containing histidine kinase [Oligoflexia bacterium]